MPNEMMSMDPNSAVREGEMRTMMDPNSVVRESEMGAMMDPNLAEDAQLVGSLLNLVEPGSGLANSLTDLGKKISMGVPLSNQIKKTLADQAMVIMNDMDPQRMRAMMDPGSAVRESEMGYTVDGQTQNMTPAQYQEMVNSGQITQDPNLMGPR